MPFNHTSHYFHISYYPDLRFKFFIYRTVLESWEPSIKSAMTDADRPVGTRDKSTGRQAILSFFYFDKVEKGLGSIKAAL